MLRFLRKKIVQIKYLIAFLKCGVIASQNGTRYDLNEFDELLKKRLDEHLNHYFRWRLPVQLSSNSYTFIHTNDGHRLYLDVKEPFMTLHLLEHGEWETAVRRELKRELSSGSKLLDIGANIGLHSLYATTLVGQSGQIIALEPHPVTNHLLTKNIEMNGLLDRVKILSFAASDSNNSDVTFDYFVEHPAMSGLKVSEEILKKYNGTVEKIKVKTITIDSLVSTYSFLPDLIKIDVEGFEYAVIKGCTTTIEENENVRFLIEYEKLMAETVMWPGVGNDIADFFQSRGYCVYRVEDESLLKLTFTEFSSEIRGDYIFKRG